MCTYFCKILYKDTYNTYFENVYIHVYVFVYIIYIILIYLINKHNSTFIFLKYITCMFVYLNIHNKNTQYTYILCTQKCYFILDVINHN